MMAAYTLSKAGRKVIVLEARNRTGGRIHTVSNHRQSTPLETGAEFIHGNLPVTLGLLKEAGISYTKTYFEILRNNNGQFEQEEEIIDGWDELLNTMHQLEQDMPLHDFLQQYFPGPQYAKMRTMVESYAMGYDTADTHDVSTFAIRSEWENEDEEAQYRIDAGYGAIIRYLAEECSKAGCEILLNKVAREINWKENEVKVITQDKFQYEASKLILAMPLGVLRAPAGREGALVFQPALQRQMEAIHHIGFGRITKILLSFKTPFWMAHDIFRISREAATKLVLSNETIPTFWTQPDPSLPMLTGWLGGPPALALQHLKDEDIMRTALASLGNIFNTPAATLEAALLHWQIADWTADPYTRGSYAYDTVGSSQARELLSEAVDETIYFAGEYLYDGAAMGTVEAALTSGKNTAGSILSH